MKKIFWVLALVILVSGTAQAAEYLSTNSLAVIGDKAFLVEGSQGAQSIVLYSFPALVEQSRLALDSNFSYANAHETGLVVYNYTYDVPVSNEESFVGPSYFKESYELKTYSLDLVPSATKLIENEYYYGFVSEPALNGASADADVAINHCKENAKGKKKKGSCDKVPVSALKKN